MLDAQAPLNESVAFKEKHLIVSKKEALMIIRNLIDQILYGRTLGIRFAPDSANVIYGIIVEEGEVK